MYFVQIASAKLSGKRSRTGMNAITWSALKLGAKWSQQLTRSKTLFPMIASKSTANSNKWKYFSKTRIDSSVLLTIVTLSWRRRIKIRRQMESNAQSARYHIAQTAFKKHMERRHAMKRGICSWIKARADVLSKSPSVQNASQYSRRLTIRLLWTAKSAALSGAGYAELILIAQFTTACMSLAPW